MEHYTRNTVSVSAYCKKCGKTTQHRVDDVRKGPCLECMAKQDAEIAARKMERAEYERQGALFGV